MNYNTSSLVNDHIHSTKAGGRLPILEMDDTHLNNMLVKLLYDLKQAQQVLRSKDIDEFDKEFYYMVSNKFNKSSAKDYIIYFKAAFPVYFLHATLRSMDTKIFIKEYKALTNYTQVKSSLSIKEVGKLIAENGVEIATSSEVKEDDLPF